MLVTEIALPGGRCDPTELVKPSQRKWDGGKGEVGGQVGAVDVDVGAVNGQLDDVDDVDGQLDYVDDVDGQPVDGQRVRVGVLCQAPHLLLHLKKQF